MKLAYAAFALLLLSDAVAVRAQPPGRSGASIPPQFHGRWAENENVCGAGLLSTAVTIDGRGWSSFEEAGEVVRVGQVREGTHYFRVNNHGRPGESTGSLAMRRDGGRILMTFHDDAEAHPVHYRLIRCR